MAGHLGMSEGEFIERYTRVRDDRRGLTLVEQAGGEEKLRIGWVLQALGHQQLFFGWEHIQTGGAQQLVPGASHQIAQRGAGHVHFKIRIHQGQRGRAGTHRCFHRLDQARAQPLKAGVGFH